MNYERMTRKYDKGGFDYHYARTLEPGETVIVKMPSPTANKRGVNDIGWQTDNAADVFLYGTLSDTPMLENTLWDKIENNDDINKTVYALKIENTSVSETRNVHIRAIMY